MGVIFEISLDVPEKTYQSRLKTSILMIFILEILALELAALHLLQNTITYEFDNSPKPSLEIIETLIDSYGKYIILFEYNYKYSLAQHLGDTISEHFNIDKLKKDYEYNINQLNRIVTIRSERISKEYAKKQESLFKIVSLFTLLISINNVISLFVGVDFSSKSDIIIFIVSILLWVGAMMYLIAVWMKKWVNKKKK